MAGVRLQVCRYEIRNAQTGLETRSVLPELPSPLERPAKLFPLRIDPQLTRIPWLTGFLRIAADVLNGIPQMLFVANDSVVAFFLPEIAGLAQGRVDPSRGKGFPTTNDVF